MKKVWFVIGLVVLIVSYRILPHPSNVTPTAALTLFWMSQWRDPSWRMWMGAPLLAIFVADLFLGFYPGVEWVYLGNLMAGLWGLGLARWNSLQLAGGIWASAVTFFVLSNLGVWLSSGLYSLTLQGLGLCYAAALPFLAKSLVGDFVFGFLIFGMARAFSLQPRSVSH